jgi:transcriptional regulator with XRE-family HTH domain
MAIGHIVRERRKAIGFTQEQVANYLGVSTPAVNKWERGITCPDIALLPALARLLKTDPNTLLQFQEGLSKEEITLFLNNVAERLKTGSFEQVFTLAINKLQEYPGCVELLHSTVLLLDGALMLSELPEAEREPYREQILALYERVAKSDDPLLSIRAKYLLASKLIERGEAGKAQEYLDALPEWNAMDKRGMQADIWSRQGCASKAAELMERKLFQSVQDHQATLCRLIRLAVQEGDETGAQALAECAKKECEAYQLGEYWSNIAPLEAAVALKDAPHSIEALKSMLDAAVKPISSRLSPLFSHIPDKESTTEFNLRFLAPLLMTLEQAPEYEFLHGVPEFSEMLDYYREKYDLRHAPPAVGI